MAFQIRVIPEELRQSASQLTNVANLNDECENKIKTLTSRLDEAWDGDLSQQMVQGLGEINVGFESGKEILYGGAKMLETVAQLFECIDSGEQSDIIAQRVNITMLDFRPMKFTIRDLFDSKILSNRIRVIPEELRQIADEIVSLSQQMDDISSQIVKLMSTLGNSWEGKAYQRFQDVFNDIDRFYKDSVDILQEFAHKISFAANRYEEIDELLGSLL